jgi:hypothetical protein
MSEKKATELVPVSETRPELPPILVGRATPAVEAQVGSFYSSVAEIFDRWVTRRSSAHTQRAYRQDVMDFVTFDVPRAQVARRIHPALHGLSRRRAFALVPPLSASAGWCQWVRGKPRKLAGKDAQRCPTSEVGLDSPAMLPTRGAGENLHHSASHVSVLADIRGGDAVAEERPSRVHDALSVRT